MDAPSLNCPRCGEAMDSLAVDGASLRECPCCHGLWCNTEALRTICESREKQTAVIEWAKNNHTNANEAAEPKVKYLPCPACRQLMNRMNFAGCSGVIVDVCRAHGTWFDRDELQRVAEFIQSGGMEKSRTLQLEDLKETERRARATQFEAALANAQTPGSACTWGTREAMFDIAQILFDLLR